MATENDKQANSGNLEVSGKGWRVIAPIAVVATLLANGGGVASCQRQDEVIKKLDAIERKVDKQNEKIGNIDVRVARIEGARGAGSQ